jgi:hypothetical protein
MTGVLSGIRIAMDDDGNTFQDDGSTNSLGVNDPVAPSNCRMAAQIYLRESRILPRNVVISPPNRLRNAGTVDLPRGRIWVYPETKKGPAVATHCVESSDWRNAVVAPTTGRPRVEEILLPQ